MPGVCEPPGKASTSVTMAILGRPLPYSAHRLVGMPAPPISTLKPAAVSVSLSSLVLSNFLHAELAEIEQRVADVGHLLRVAVDHLEGELLALVGRRNAGEREHEPERQNDLRADDLAPHVLPSTRDD